MRILFAIALVLALLVTIFAVQNNASTTISFLFWSVESSLALVLMLTLVLGIVIGVLLMTPGSVRSRLQVGGLQRAVRSTERSEGDQNLQVEETSEEPVESVRPEHPRPE